jgi:predicted RNA binding protein YcfA (HicA-like mRNA interferase family)
MPAKVKTLEKVAKKLGFVKVRQKGSHARKETP